MVRYLALLLLLLWCSPAAAWTVDSVSYTNQSSATGAIETGDEETDGGHGPQLVGRSLGYLIHFFL
jgi:hypothetical protein